MSLRSTYLSCVLLSLSATPAFCTPILYGDPSSWLNAVSSPTTVTFDGAGSAVGNYNSAAGFQTGLSLPDNPTFVGTEVLNGVPNFSLSILDSTIDPSLDFGSGNSLWWAGYNGVTSPMLQVTFPTAVSAFSVDLMTFGATGFNYTVELNNDPTLVYTSNPTQPNPTQTFFGLTSTDIPITSIDFYLGPESSGATPLIDNFSYAVSLEQSDGGDTPEPCTLLLLASGLLGMALISRRLRGFAVSLQGA